MNVSGIESPEQRAIATGANLVMLRARELGLGIEASFVLRDLIAGVSENLIARKMAGEFDGMGRIPVPDC